MSESLWGNIAEPDVQSVSEILARQAEILYHATTGRVRASSTAVPREERSHPGTVYLQFAYEFGLFSEKLNGFYFRMFRFAHNIELYPVVFTDIDEMVLAEFGVDSSARFSHTVSRPEEAMGFIGNVLKTARVSSVVAGMRKMSK